MPRLIALSGLPGVGKTTLARSLAGHIGAVFLRIDSFETALRQSALAIDRAEDAGYCIGYAAAQDNLRLGHDVVADAVNPVAQTRLAWAAAAASAGAPIVNVEIVCSDMAEHRRRVEARKPDREGQVIPDWSRVRARAYTPWDAPRIVVDTAALSPAAALGALLAQIDA